MPQDSEYAQASLFCKYFGCRKIAEKLVADYAEDKRSLMNKRLYYVLFLMMMLLFFLILILSQTGKLSEDPLVYFFQLVTAIYVTVLAFSVWAIFVKRQNRKTVAVAQQKVLDFARQLNAGSERWVDAAREML